MRNYKSILCLLLSLVLIVSVVFPMGASAVEEPGAGGSGTKGVTVNFICGDKIFDPVMIYVDANKTEITPADLAEAIPAGYALANDQTYVLKFDNPIYVELVDTKTIWVDFVDEKGNPVFSTNMTVPYAATTVNSDDPDLVGLIPTGYEVAAPGVLTIDNGHLEVVVKQIPYDKYIVVSYVLEDGTVVGTEEYATKTNVSQFDPADLKNVPDGYKIVNMNKLNLLPGTVELNIQVAKVEDPAPATRRLLVNYVTASGAVISRERVTIAKDATELPMTSLKRIPDGYKLVDEKPVEITAEMKSVDVLVAKIEDPVPETRTLLVNYVTASGAVISRERVTIAKDATQLLMTSLKRVPAGYKLVNNEPRGISDKTKSVDILVESTSRVIMISYVNQYGTVVGTEDVRVEKSMNQFDPAVLTNVPEGYAIVNMNKINIMSDTMELELLVERTTRTLVVKYVTESGREIATERVTIAKSATQLFMGSLKRVPAGYKLVNEEPRNITSDTKTLDILVESTSRVIMISYVNQYGTVVGTEDVRVEKSMNQFDPAVLTNVPEGYAIVNMNKINIMSDTMELELLVERTTRTLVVKYVTEAGREIATERVTIAKSASQLFMSSLKRVPAGYELVNNEPRNITSDTKTLEILVVEQEEEILVNYVTEDGDLVLTSSMVVKANQDCVNTALLTDVPYGYEIAVNGDLPIKGNHIDVVVREKEYTKSIIVNYVDEEGNLVLTSDILMSKEATHVNTSLLTDVPYGYEIAVTGDVRIENNTVTVVVREKEYTKSVLVNYVNEEDNKCVLTSSIVVYMDATSVNTSLLTDVPYGYEIAIAGDMPIEGKQVNVFVREKTYTKSVVVNYITEDGKLVLTSDVVVLDELTSVNTSVLTDVPYGYEIAVTGDMPIEGNHIDVVVRLTPYTKSVLVNYVTEDGTCVLTSDIVMDIDATCVNTSMLTDVPYGYAIAITGDMPIENGQVFVTVRSTYVPEPTVPEETKPEETKPEETKPEETKPEETKPEESKPVETKPAATEGKTPNTGDASHAMTWVLLLTVSAVCAVCAFFFLKKGNANR